MLGWVTWFILHKSTSPILRRTQKKKGTTFFFISGVLLFCDCIGEVTALNGGSHLISSTKMSKRHFYRKDKDAKMQRTHWLIYLHAGQEFDMF